MSHGWKPSLLTGFGASLTRGWGCRNTVRPAAVGTTITENCRQQRWELWRTVLTQTGGKKEEKKGRVAGRKGKEKYGGRGRERGGGGAN